MTKYVFDETTLINGSFVAVSEDVRDRKSMRNGASTAKEVGVRRCEPASATAYSTRYGPPHGELQDVVTQDVSSAKSESTPQLADGVSADMHREHSARLAHTFAWLQQDSPRQASHADDAVVSASAHAGGAGGLRS